MFRTALLVALVGWGCGWAQADEGRRVRQALIKQVDTLPIPKAALEDVVGSFSERFNLIIVIDTAAFRAKEIDDVEQQRVELPKLIGVSLHTTLRLVAGQVGGAIVQVGGQVWIVPQEDRVPRMMGQKVDVRAKDQTIGQVLDDLRERTGANIILDDALEGALERKVNCDLKQVRLDRAVERLVSLTKLDVVLYEDCLYVGMPDVVHQLRLLQEADMPR